MRKLIAITGFRNAGKDTIADYLVKKYGYTKLSFAGAVKDVASVVFDWDRDMLEGSTVESRLKREIVDEWWSKRLGIKNLTPRWVLQNFGTELFRNHFHDEIWIANLERKIMKYDKVVITDCRFPNEYDMVKKYDGTIISVFRDDVPEWFNDIKNDTIKHPPCISGHELHSSDWLWIKFNTDFTVYNNSTLNNLYEQVDDIIFR